jgi:ADP-ribose pyrophosphatase YjhB (NUDIX family)
MKKVTTAGGIVINRGAILLIKKSGGFTFPKGHLKESESLENAALREVEEETGTKAVIVKNLGHFTRRSTEDDGEVVDKDVHMFLMSAIGETDSQPDEKFEWISLQQYENIQMHFKEEAKFLTDYLHLTQA